MSDGIYAFQTKCQNAGANDDTRASNTVGRSASDAGELKAKQALSHPQNPAHGT